MSSLLSKNSASAASVDMYLSGAIRVNGMGDSPQFDGKERGREVELKRGLRLELSNTGASSLESSSLFFSSRQQKLLKFGLGRHL